MFRKLTISVRLAGGFTSLVAITIAVLALFYLLNSNQLIAEAEKPEMESLYVAASSQINTQALYAEAMSAIIANQPSVQQAFAVLIAYGLSRTIVNPLRTTVTTLQDIADGEGDLTRRLDENGQDELSELAKGYNLFISKIHELVQQVVDTTNQMATATEELSAIASETRQGVVMQRDQTTQVATAILK